MTNIDMYKPTLENQFFVYKVNTIIMRIVIVFSYKVQHINNNEQKKIQHFKISSLFWTKNASKYYSNFEYSLYVSFLVKIQGELLFIK